MVIISHWNKTLGALGDGFNLCPHVCKQFFFAKSLDPSELESTSCLTLTDIQTEKS